ncbi:MAG: hypothetical protein RSA29_05290 [Clostridium sp.]|uniref:hypothetical protein n=1 Tax=Clostridium sp. TaxID=1506 RepID=UPI00304B0B8A
MNNTNKLYKKAMNYYCDGMLDKSLKCCDKILVIERGHSPTLNLKGLIYYINGNLEEAKYSWNLSYKLNGDVVSKKYLDDSRIDEGNEFIFSQGVLLFNEIKIREALKCFMKCEKSNFNSLKLWNYISKCYMQLGQHQISVKYVGNVLELDRNNEEALKIKSQLIELGFIVKKKNEVSKKTLISLVVIVFVIVLGISVLSGYKLLSKRNQEKIQAGIDSNLDNFQGNNEKNNSNVDNSVSENEKGDEKKGTESLFQAKELNKYIENEEYENIINYISKHDISTLAINDKIVVQNAVDLIKTKGVIYLYEKGSNLIKDNNIEDAITSLKLAYEYSGESYLNEHILFMIGVSYEKLGNIENSNKYYEGYVDKYLEEGSYIEQCIYSLAVSNASVDIEKAKLYARIIVDKFQDSEYNNTKIKEILQ